MQDKAAKAFVFTTLILLTPALWGVLTHGHLELHAAINRHTSPTWDPVFAYGTNLADGWIAGVAGLACS
jgi:hypothetical protein